MHPASTSSPPVRPFAPRGILAALTVAVALLVAALPATAQEAPRPTPRPQVWSSDAGTSQLFHVSIVAASRQGASASPGSLPAAISKALADLKEFLPYQSYRVVDSALVRASREFHTRLAGPDGTPYDVDAVFSAEDGGKSFLINHFELHKVPRMEDVARDMDRSRGSAPVAPMAPEPGLTASFRIDRGETVVVGSSRLDGDGDALIVLLTAVP